MSVSSPTHTERQGPGYALTRFNAVRHGVLSRQTVLPWEDETEYQTLLEALATEHTPEGPTEEHLVEELAGVLWRTRRLRLAEAAAHRRGLEDTLAPYRETVKAALVHLDTPHESDQLADAIRMTDRDTAEAITEIEEDEAMTSRAIKQLHSGKRNAYNAALAMLREDTREWWEESLTEEPEEGDEPYAADSDGLLKFLEAEVLKWYATRRNELSNRPLIREQAFGESLDPDKLERLARYETHLDRKLERTLAMLLRLKELRRSDEPD